jgi:hypothetical protein
VALNSAVNSLLPLARASSPLACRSIAALAERLASSRIADRSIDFSGATVRGVSSAARGVPAGGCAGTAGPGASGAFSPIACLGSAAVFGGGGVLGLRTRSNSRAMYWSIDSSSWSCGFDVEGAAVGSHEFSRADPEGS